MSECLPELRCLVDLPSCPCPSGDYVCIRLATITEVKADPDA